MNTPSYIGTTGSATALAFGSNLSITVLYPATVFSAPTLTNSAPITIQSANPVNFEPQLVISANTFTNNATINNVGGVLVDQASTTNGTGTLRLSKGAAAAFQGATAATQKIQFVDGAKNVLVVGNPAAFQASIAGFVTGDTIDLAGVDAAYAWVTPNNLLQVHETDGSDIYLNLSGDYSNESFTVTSDGTGGTNITVGPSVLDFLQFSGLAYAITEHPNRPFADGSTVADLSIDGFQVAAYTTDPYAMNAVVFENPSTHQVVFAFRGTNLLSSFDRQQIADISAGERPPAFDQAEALVKQFMPLFPGDTFYVTGHSLGGAEAEDVGAVFDLGGVTFAAPGVSNLLPPGTAPTDTRPLTNYVNPVDGVGVYASDTEPAWETLILPSNNGSHIGTVTFLTPVNNDQLAAAAAQASEGLATGDLRLVLSGLIAATASQHGLPVYAQALANQGLIPFDPYTGPSPLNGTATVDLQVGFNDGLASSAAIGFDGMAQPAATGANAGPHPWALDHPAIALGVLHHLGGAFVA